MQPHSGKANLMDAGGARAQGREADWPPLPLAQWHPTLTTLQRWTQMVGKTLLDLAPAQNHWWHVVLHLSARGLKTPPIPCAGCTFEIELDFLDHQLVVRTSAGDRRSIALVPKSVADFYAEYVALLHSLRIKPRIWPVPREMPDALPFADDRVHADYDADAAQRCWRVLAQTDRVLKQFRGRFLGKCSPAHFWWGGFDIACTRFSGRRAPEHPGGIPNVADYVTRQAYSHECISAGWWPGVVDGPVADAAFYAYAYPEPSGCAQAPIAPSMAFYQTQMREWILPYESVRTATDPSAALLEFLDSTYSVAATLGNWDREALEKPR